MMNPTSPIIFTPMALPLNPGHDLPHSPNSAVLDLCVRKRPLSPNYPHDYKCSPNYIDVCTSPKSTSGMSDFSDVSCSETRDLNANFPRTRTKCSRPFKAYPKDPLSIALLGSASENILGKDSTDAYTEFRKKLLAQVHANHNGTNKNMRRTQSLSIQSADPIYWEKRKKNNEAAKRSRDARRAKEDEIAIRCAFLEQENLQLKFRLAALESERERLQNMIYQ